MNSDSRDTGDRAATVWSGMVPLEDTALAVTDTGGAGTPVVYLNGSYANQAHWRRVISELGPGWRHITFDERARGRSRRSADYSFEACLRDIDAVLAARDVRRPVLVGWSYGAALAVHWAHRNPREVTGVVAVDGAFPYDWIDDDARRRIRTLFRRLSPVFPLARRFGLAARFSAAQHAQVNIEINEILGALGPVLAELRTPSRWVVASGGNLGGGAQEMEYLRTTLDPILAANPWLHISAKVASNHSAILRKDFAAVAQAVREIAGVEHDGGAGLGETG